VFSIGSAFIDNRDLKDTPPGASAEQRKQDCELKALRRLGESLRQDCPQLPLCVSGDSLDACGEGLQIAKDYRLSFVFTFKQGRLPALWADFQGLSGCVRSSGSSGRRRRGCGRCTAGGGAVLHRQRRPHMDFYGYSM